jgi:hypothetical protein
MGSWSSTRNVTAAVLCAVLPVAALAEPACRVEPFGQQSVADGEQLLRQPCGGEHLQLNLETPRARPEDPGPSLVHARVVTSVSQPLVAGLLGTLKFSWAGTRNEADGELRTDRTALAAGTLVRVSDELALQANLGRELTAAFRNRATLATLWQPTRAALAFVEWAGSANGTEAQRVGARWWLLRHRLSLDVAATHQPDGIGWSDHRVGLTLAIRP